jgi:protein-S-isoprenylcysteine O-methyltransferase Ste14
MSMLKSLTIVAGTALVLLLLAIGTLAPQAGSSSESSDVASPSCLTSIVFVVACAAVLSACVFWLVRIWRIRRAGCSQNKCGEAKGGRMGSTPDT